MRKAVCCTRCQSVGLITYMRNGSPRVGLLLLCLFVVPGVLYFLGYFLSGHWGCNTCGSREVVPLLERESFQVRRMQAEERLA
jgi:hypothetical protein